ncbi:hypothetical protein C0J52_02109 [Blattella germanica]|nr:hypothetical protein C0J52_02109 [Blattella germanica]
MAMNMGILNIFKRNSSNRIHFYILLRNKESTRQISDSIYDFHDESDDDNLMIDETPKKRKTVLEPFSSLKLPSKFIVFKGLYLNGKTEPSSELDVAGEVDVVSDTPKNVYPALDGSDDEDLIFKPRGKRKMDEAWNPKARVGPLVPKTDRPTREGTKKQAVEKGLEAAAAKRAGMPVHSLMGIVGKILSVLFVINIFNELLLILYSSSGRASPSTREAIAGMLSISRVFMSDHGNSKDELNASRMRKRKSLNFSDDYGENIDKVHQDEDYRFQECDQENIKNWLKCDVDDPGHQVLTDDEIIASVIDDQDLCDEEEEPSDEDFRKPKKGMATAKQRLGKILKIHKMKF